MRNGGPKFRRKYVSDISTILSSSRSEGSTLRRKMQIPRFGRDDKPVSNSPVCLSAPCG
jgi:hypothetical protein